MFILLDGNSLDNIIKSNDDTSIRFYGITQDPGTHSCMMVLEYANDGNLQEYLKINFNNINWKKNYLIYMKYLKASSSSSSSSSS
ncbi:hypothetical protein Glove_624g39 [Diversispora epigaea]|uniref:Protein kinase domain-containing protein n=1 Tax=Diversispora epigaea TaxID=1348612 RepID=A0A397G5M0_9GLOM|nr:hypothetical protein Glove_624g39 [Diversispora epigaea]